MSTADRTPPSAGRLRRLFDELAERPAAEREQALAGLSGEDAALRDELALLLAAHDRAGGFLEAPATVDLIGRRLGDYRVEGPLGRGGMGAVFLARRADGAYEQTVAIKLLDRFGPDDERSIRRFERERQTLARLAHRHVARLLDGGTTGDGTPYLVMEYVAGEPLDRWCDQRRLPIEARLRLFLQVCSGIEHAHRHLVVHRDLKPGNVLVTEDGEVKLLDFGIARLLGELDGAPPGEARREEAPLTVAGAYTPGYASPEQLRGGEVTPASDVFSLGVVLYELLSGVHPYLGHGVAAAETADALKRETVPPSAALTSRAGAAADAARRAADLRGVDLPRLRRALRGDLDAILLKALARDPAERYAGAGELAADLERHLARRPVGGRAGERGYASRRFVRRHRLGVAAAALVLLSLVAGLAAASWQARRAERAQAVAERRFDQVQELASALLFDVHDAVARLPGATPARHLIVDRALGYLDRLAAEAAGDAALQLEIATAYERIGDIQGNPQQSNLGDTESALASYRRALALRGAQPETARRDAGLRAAIARTRHRIGDVLWWTGDTAAAAEQLELAIAGWRGLAEEEPEEPRWRLEWAASVTGVARVLHWNGDHDAALVRWDTAERLLRPLFGGPLEDAAAEARALVWQGRGETLGWMGEVEPGIAWIRRARDELGRLSAARPLDTPLRRRLYLASLRLSQHLADRSMEEAAASFPATLALAREIAAADPADARARRDLSLAHATFGDVLSGVGREEEALDQFRRAREIQRQLAVEDPNNLGHRADLANSEVRIGYVLQEEGEHRAALDSFDEALDLRRPLLEADPEDSANRRDVAVIESARGDSLAALARRPAACAAYRDSLALWRELDGSGLLREYDRPQLDHAAAGVEESCAGGVSGS